MNIHRSKTNKPQGFGIDECRYIPVTEFVAQSNGSIRRKGRKVQLHKSLYLEEIIRPGTRMTQIKRIYTDSGGERQEKAPEHGEAMIVSLSNINKPQMKVPRVAPLEGVCTSTVAPVDVAHTYGSPPYVDIAARYARRHAWARSREPAGFRHDERRLIAFYHRKGHEERKAEEQKSLRPLRSLRLINFHGIPTAQGNKATVVFQTGFTGSTGW